MATRSGRSSVIRLMFWKMASAVPLYQSSPVRICAGTKSTYWSRLAFRFHAAEICLFSESLLNCVRTLILKMPELMKLFKTKSMMR